MDKKFAFFKIARIGWRFILPCVLLAAFFLIAGFEISALVFLLLSGCLMFFFRDPERHPPRITGSIVSPADGKVMGIKEINDELESFGLEGKAGIGKGKKLDIFMSLFDVHINRSPIDGEVVDLQYRRGRFFTASKEKASEKNEANLVFLKNESVRVLVKQIAGRVARRIICPLRVGQKVKKGERIGLICFGSRVEVILPAAAEIKVRKGQHLRGGESIIAILPPEVEREDLEAEQ